MSELTALETALENPARPLLDMLPAQSDAIAVTEEAALAYAAALAGSAPRVARFANLLPPERRASHDRAQYLIPGILGSLLVLGLVTVFIIFPAIEQRRYRDQLDRERRNAGIDLRFGRS